MEPTRSSCLVARARAIWTVLALLGLLAAVPGLTAHADDAGYALAFDGINDLVLLPETVSVMGPGWETSKTVSLWVKPTGSAVTCAYNNIAECDAIFGDRSRWWGIVRGVLNGQDRLWVWNYDASSGSPFDILPVDYVPGKWVHVTLVHGAGSLRVYRNGVQVGGTPSGATRQPTGGALPHLYLGGIINNTSRNWTFEGLLDEVSLWNVARTEAQVQADMFRTLAGNESGLRAYYAMSDGSGTVLTDDGPADWNGTLLDGMQGVPPNGGPAQWIISDAFSGTPSTPTPTITGLPSVSPTTTLTPTETSTPTATAIASSTPTPGQPGEFPTTGILDAFDRPNGAIGAAWSGSVSSYAIASEHLEVNGNGSIFWNGTSFGADQEAFVTLSALDAGAGSISLLLKSQANSTANNGVLRVMYLPATQVVQIWTYASSQGWVQRGTNLSASLAPGDQLGAKATADGSIEVYRNGALLGARSATGWTFFASGGFVGLWMSNASNVVLDDFGGGSSGASPLPTASATPTATPAGPTLEPTSTSTPTETIVVPTPTASYTPVPGSFPLTGTLDDFNRADGVIGSNWSGSVGAYAISGHRLDVNANGSIQWNADSFGADQEAFVTIAALDGGSGSVSLVLKSQSSTGPTDGALRVMFSPSSQLAQVWTLTAGQGWVQRGSNVSVALASGDVLGARARADGMVEIFRNGNLMATRDASGWANAGAPGYVGLWMSSATNTLLDDFGGGTVTD